MLKALALCLLVVSSAAQAQTEKWSQFLTGAPDLPEPVQLSDSLPVVRAGKTYKTNRSILFSPIPLVATSNISINSNAYCGQEVDLGGSTNFTVTVSAATAFPTGCIIKISNTDTLNGKYLSIPGITPYYQNTLFPKQTIIIRSNGATWLDIVKPGPLIVPIGSTLHMYVDPTGVSCSGTCSDTNDGLTAANAKFSSLGAVTQAMTYQYQCSNGGVTATVIHLLGAEPSTAPAIHTGPTGISGGCSGGTMGPTGSCLFRINRREANGDFSSNKQRAPDGPGFDSFCVRCYQK